MLPDRKRATTAMANLPTPTSRSCRPLLRYEATGAGTDRRVERTRREPGGGGFA